MDRVDGKKKKKNSVVVQGSSAPITLLYVGGVQRC